MKEEDRDLDRKYIFFPEKSRKGVSRDVIKSAFIVEGLSSEELASRFNLSKNIIEKIIREDNLPALRKLYITQGIGKAQSSQMDYANKLLNIDNNFKSLRLIQLQERMEEYMAYYARFGDLKKRHPITNEILKDDNGLAILLKIPDISKEIKDLKESLTLSSGVLQILNNLENLVCAGQLEEPKSESSVIDVTEYAELFERKEE